MVERLEVKVLPCVICFVHGVTKDRYVCIYVTRLIVSNSIRLIGFEELGNDDSFTTSALELRLSQSGV